MSNASKVTKLAPVHQNAPHIFNAIHSSLRQWGSSLNHNGLSLFPATVPADTRLYHGGSSAQPITGLKWLSFEAQHALMFAKPTSAPSFAEKNRQTLKEKVDTCGRGQGMFDEEKEEGKGGYLHEYVTRRQLRVVVFDGMSAGKTNMGTLDLQDIVLLNHTSGSRRLSDKDRVEKLCKVLRGEGSPDIDGFIRMEWGFEIIVCEAETVLKPVHVGATRPIEFGVGNMRMNSNADSLMAYFRTIAGRYHISGKTRVAVDYEAMISAYELVPSEELFADRGLPRLRGVSQSYMVKLRRNIIDPFRKYEWAHSSHNWQEVTDLIVSRYANILPYIARTKDERELKSELRAVLEPFTDYSQRKPMVDIERCAIQDMGADLQPSVVSRTTFTVAKRICSTLAEAEQMEDDVLKRKAITKLILWLGWTVWNYCDTCSYGEICWIPIWPLGSIADRNRPRCHSTIRMVPNSEERYWR